MIFSRKRGEKCKFDIPMTPMIDVIFQLLIFFMCSIRFKTLEGKLETNLPTDIGLNPAPAPVPVEPIRVRLWLEKPDDPETLRIMIRQNPCAGFEDLQAKLDGFLQSLSPSDRQEARVVIDSRPEVQFKHIVHVLDICKTLEVVRTEFAAPPPVREGGASP